MKSQDVAILAQVLIEVGEYVHNMKEDITDKDETTEFLRQEIETITESKKCLQVKFDSYNERRQVLELRIGDLGSQLKGWLVELSAKKRKTDLEVRLLKALSLMRERLDGSVMTNTANKEPR